MIAHNIKILLNIQELIVFALIYSLFVSSCLCVLVFRFPKTKNILGSMKNPLTLFLVTYIIDTKELNGYKWKELYVLIGLA